MGGSGEGENPGEKGERREGRGRKEERGRGRREEQGILKSLSDALEG